MGDVLDIGARVPRTRGGFWSGVGRCILRAYGWRMDIHLPDEPKLMVIAAPHTSNWDFVFGMAAILAARLRINWYAKHSLFTGLWGGFFRMLGGMPVDRGAPGGVVAQTAAFYGQTDQMLIALAPEGTRSRVTRWKRGFHHIALAAGVPVVIAYIDYRNRTVGTRFWFRPTADWDADMRPVFEFYRGITPKKPENFATEG